MGKRNQGWIKTVGCRNAPVSQMGGPKTAVHQAEDAKRKRDLIKAMQGISRRTDMEIAKAERLG
jgi:hypothetical protein